MVSPAQYINFDLLITRAGDGYRAFVIDAPGGDADRSVNFHRGET